MLSDRFYMRHEASHRQPGFLAWFLGALAAVFVLQSVFTLWFGSDAILRHGALSTYGLFAGEFWTPVTYALLHGNLTHLLLNCLGLFFVGRALQNALGSRRLAWLTLSAALGGAAAWFAIYFNRAGVVIGASGIVMAYLTVFACMQPWKRMTVLLFFIIPVSIQPVWLVCALGGIDLFGLLTKELPGDGTLYGIAQSAHLGGMAAGWLFHRLVIAPKIPRTGALIEPPAWLRKRAHAPASAYSVNMGPSATRAAEIDADPEGSPPIDPVSRAALKAEVDRILDKINLHGFGSLTATEKRVLDEARQQLSHR